MDITQRCLFVQPSLHAATSPDGLCSLLLGWVHSQGEKAFTQKQRTGPWQLFGGTSTHQSLPLDETAPNTRVSWSCNSQLFEILYLQEFCFSRPRHFFQKSTKIIKKNRGAVPAPFPYGATPLPPTKVGAKCVAAVELAHHDRVLSPFMASSFSLFSAGRLTPVANGFQVTRWKCKPKSPNSILQAHPADSVCYRWVIQ